MVRERWIEALIILVTVILAIPLVIAVPLINVPARHEGLTGTSTFVNVSEATSTDQVLNMSWFLSNDAGVTWRLLNSTENDTAESVEFNTTFDSTVFADGPVIINVTSFNGTATTFRNDNTTDAEIDNTAPNTTYGAGTPGDLSEVDVSNVSILIATGDIIVNCTMSTAPPMNNTNAFYTPNDTVGGCSVNVLNIPDLAYEYNISVTDGLNASTLTTRTVIVNTKGGSILPLLKQREAQAKAEAGKQQNTMWIFFVIAAIVLIIYANRKK